MEEGGGWEGGLVIEWHAYFLVKSVDFHSSYC